MSIIAVISRVLMGISGCMGTNPLPGGNIAPLWRWWMIRPITIYSPTPGGIRDRKIRGIQTSQNG